MAHFGFLTLSVLGHLFPMSTFARDLQARGHRVTFFCFEDAEDFLRRAGLDTVVIARKEIPLGHTKQAIDTLSQLSGPKGVTYTFEVLCHEANAQFAELPDAIRAAGINALIIDQFAMSGATIADYLRLPHVHVAAAMLANAEDDLPPINVGFGPERNIFALARNRLIMAIAKRFYSPIRKRLNQQRLLWGLPPYTEFFNERFSHGPQICQQPPSFEFPRRTLPANFHFVGPLHSREIRKDVPFLWEQLDGRPLVYASMGTLQNGMGSVFKVFAEGCAALNVQLILSLGGNLDPANFAGLPGGPLVVRFAPQLKLLQRAAVCITHAGLNTALESLAHGVPMVAVPITNDQPGVAARIKWTGTGRTLTLKTLNPNSLREAVGDVLTNPSYKENATRLQREIAGLDSLQRACKIAEAVVAQEVVT